MHVINATLVATEVNNQVYTQLNKTLIYDSHLAVRKRGEVFLKADCSHETGYGTYCSRHYGKTQCDGHQWP